MVMALVEIFGRANWEIEEERRKDYIREIDKRLGPYPPDCTSKGGKNTPEDAESDLDSMLSLDFHPGRT